MNIARRTGTFSVWLAAALLALAFWACTSPEKEEGDHYLDFTLSESLADYERVVVTLVDAGDTGKVLETLHDDKMPDPGSITRHKLNEAKGKRFILRVRAYNQRGELVLSKDIEVDGATAKAPVIIVGDLRLRKLSPSVGALKPAFSPEVLGYSVEVAETETAIRFDVQAMDPANSLSINGAAKPWGQAEAQALSKGDNLFTFTAASPDGKASRSYQVAVVRGEPSLHNPEQPVEALSLAPKSLRLWLGEPSQAIAATVLPLGTRVYFSSENTGVATVDRFGNVTPNGHGNTYVVARAGNKADTASVQVIKDSPVVNVGASLAVKVGSEVVFTITVNQQHGSIAVFKYDLEGDGTWDNADSSAAPETLKHTYKTARTYTAKFYVRDTEGNVVEPTRSINVTEDDLLVAITWPGRDTAVNATPIVVRFTVDEGAERSQSFPLVEGPNPLVVNVEEGGKKGKAALNVTLDTKKPDVEITSPAEGAVTRESSIKVDWKVDGAAQSTLTTQDLGGGDGEKIITREWTDAAGNVGKDEVKVIRDTKAPLKPSVRGTSPTNSAPRWTWSSGGGNGAGVFRHRLGNAEFPADAPSGTDTSFAMPATPVPANGSKHTLFVQERDAAGNWSEAGSLEITFDVSKPVVTLSTPQSSGTWVTRAASTAVTGKAAGPHPIEKVVYKLNGVDAAAAELSDTLWSIPTIDLVDGVKTQITVVATDKAGNSGEASLTLHRDNTPPSAPAITASPASPTQNAKGSWTWGPVSDGANGSGPNGKFRYALNGGAWNEGSFASVTDLNLVEGVNTFAVQGQDLAGNWSLSTSNQVRVDRVGPSVAITSHNSPATSGTLKITISGTVSDTGSGVQTVAVTGQQSGSGAATLTGGTWTTGELTLKNGVNSLVATATDKVGNTSTAILNVNVDVTTPTVTILSPSNGHLTTKDTVTVRYRVNAGAEQTKVFSPANGNGLAEGNNNLEIVSPPNELGVTGKNTVLVVKDAAVPNAPTLSTADNLTDADPEWTWIPNGDNTGGAGLAAPPEYRYSLNGAAAVATSNASFTVAGAADGAYSLTVQVKDKAGNWSAPSNAVSITVDKTDPVIVITSPADGFITNLASVLVTYTEANGGTPVNKSQTVTLANDNGIANVVTISSAPDAAGNVGTRTINLYRRSNVIFVRANAPSGGDGATWATAYQAIQPALAAATSGKQIWVGAGTYASNAVDAGFTMKAGVGLYGGFNAAGGQRNLSDRVFASATTTVLRNPAGYVITMNGASATNMLQNVAVDGFEVRYEKYSAFTMSYAAGISIANCHITHVLLMGLAISSSNSSYAVTGTKFTGHGFEVGPVNSSGSGSIVSFTDCEFSGNDFPASYTKLVALDVQEAIFTRTRFLDALKYPENRHISLDRITGTLRVKQCSFKSTGEAASIANTGTKDYAGNTYNPNL